ncbi:MAG: acyl-ACP--UDP-N-acetylglucosamine O-acyltransferase [Planctomycetota bacterium]
MDYEQRGGAWIHQTAEVHESVVLEPGVVIGPHSKIGRDCSIGANAVIGEHTTLGADNRVSATAVLGGDPQDASYAGETTRLEIGERNVFREGVTINRGSTKENFVTRVGNDNYFMAGSHLGHDVVVEDGCTFANGVLIAGHCHIATGANFAGSAAVVQFCTVGRLSFVGGMAGCRQDPEPFLIHDRSGPGSDPRARPTGVNKVGLRRAGVSDESIRHLMTAFRLLFGSSKVDPGAARAQLDAENALCDEVAELLEFVDRKRAGSFGRQKAVPKKAPEKDVKSS